MNILILANFDVGLYQFRKELIEELLKNNKVIISLPKGDLVKELVDIGCEFIETEVDRRGLNPKNDLKLLYQYIKIIKHKKPDFVITYTIKPNVYGGMICRLFKIPYAVNITGLGSAFESGVFLKTIATIMNKLACKNAKVVFFENEENRRLFVNKKIVPKDIAYRLNGAGVNLDKYKFMDYPKEGTIKFLFMGRVMAEKGINELLDAMKLLKNNNVDFQLHILGEYEENYKTEIENCEKEGWLFYHGYQKDVKYFIKKCHCFVLPSWHEGMANTNLESASSGRPIITSDIAGCKEAVVDGISGFIVKAKNTNSLYDGLLKFINLSYEEKKYMGIQGRKHMEQIFDRKKVVQETIKCIFGGRV